MEKNKMYCESCKFWGSYYGGECTQIGEYETGDKKFDLYMYALDDTGLDVALITGPKFGCIHHVEK